MTNTPIWENFALVIYQSINNKNKNDKEHPNQSTNNREMAERAIRYVVREGVRSDTKVR